MWKTIGRWTLGVASSVLLTAPALSARADDSQQMQNEASQAGQEMKNAGTSVGNAAESSGKAVGNTAEGAWNSSRNAVGAAGDSAAQAGHQAAETVKPASAKDDQITSQVKQRLSTAEPTATNVDVDTKNHVVTLSGSVSSEASRRHAVDIAREVEGVKKVKDHLKVNPNQ